MKTILLILITFFLVSNTRGQMPNTAYSLYKGGPNVLVTRQATYGEGSHPCGFSGYASYYSYFFSPGTNSAAYFSPYDTEVYGNIQLLGNAPAGNATIKYSQKIITGNGSVTPSGWVCSNFEYRFTIFNITVTVEDFKFSSTPPSAINMLCGSIDFKSYLNVPNITWAITSGSGNFVNGVFTPTTNGPVTIKGTKTYSNGTATVTHSFTVQNPVTISASTKNPMVGEPVDFTTSINNAADYVWDFGDGFTFQNINGYHFYYEPGPKTIKLTLTSASSPVCTQTFTFTNFLTVQPIDIVTNLDEDHINGIMVYPIPFDDYLTFKVNSDLIADIQITTMQGNRVLLFNGYKLSSGENKLPLQLDPGIYILDVTSKNQNRKFKTIKK